jgi:hypothetical protein
MPTLLVVLVLDPKQLVLVVKFFLLTKPGYG